ncbi:MAG TPA: hypothetical protein VKK79_19070 [Candidatus Lokiarchaeia archaeon]|nr:hypothetical protein [Candidatus Lokiarchaeia archaeon]
MSFYIDWWLLIVMGAVIALITRLKPLYRKDGFLFYWLCAIVLVFFFILSVGLFCQLTPADNSFLGNFNQAMWALIKGDTTSMWGQLASLSPYGEYYKELTAWSLANGVPLPTSTEFMYSSGEAFIKCGANGAWVSNASGTLIQISTIDYPIFTAGPLNVFPFTKGVPFNDLTTLVNYHRVYLFGGICLFITYPGWLYLGTQIGYLLFGRKPGDKGILYML